MPTPHTSGYAYHASPASRLIAGALTALFLALALLVLVLMGRYAGLAGPGRDRLVAIAMPQGRKAEHHAKAASAAAARRQPVPPQPQPLVETPPLEHHAPLQLIHLSRAEMAAADIGHMARPEAAGGSPGDSKTAYGPGEGPGGAHLYNAEWYREPSHAEIAGYLPGRGAPPGSWAMIACQTVDHYHVENCQQLGESPPGSGLSRALREAAWQFLVRPPRINGKPQIGAWVRIRFDFTRKGAGGDTADGDTR
ncbi:MAG: hypothetical protein JSS36_10630 [Proteobacteria bacterium]|nr:hypothetical protein [Pseudomonadota bacterium]